MIEVRYVLDDKERFCGQASTLPLLKALSRSKISGRRVKKNYYHNGMLLASYADAKDVLGKEIGIR